MQQEPPHSGDLDPRMREAIAWIARLTSGEASTGDAEKLMAWRRSSPGNEEAYQQAARLWKASGSALVSAPARPQARLSRRRFLQGGAIAASVAGITCTGSYFGLLPTLQALAADYATGVGEQQRVTLDDATVVDLDGRSALSVDYTADARAVSLATGAALFKVSEDRRRPFVVSAQGGEISSTGNSFAVTCGAERVQAACVDGRLHVDCRGGEVELAQGESVTYSADGLGPKTRVPLDSIGAWRRGLLIFQDRRLSEVVQDVNRHRLGRVIIGRSDLAERRITGVFHLDRPDEVLEHLEATLQLTEVSLAGVVVLY